VVGQAAVFDVSVNGGSSNQPAGGAQLSRRCGMDGVGDSLVTGPQRKSLGSWPWT
jgi:hypothetical protein